MWPRVGVGAIGTGGKVLLPFRLSACLGRPGAFICVVLEVASTGHQVWCIIRGSLRGVWGGQAYREGGELRGGSVPCVCKEGRET